MTITLNKYSDELGMLSSGLCIIHCLATPILLTALPVTSAMNPGTAGWWGWLDIIFLLISFFAVYQTIRNTSIKWIKSGLIISFILLTLSIVNERYIGVEFPVDIVYFPAVALVVFHLINLRQCRHKEGGSNHENCVTGS